MTDFIEGWQDRHNKLAMGHADVPDGWRVFLYVSGYRLASYKLKHVT